MQTPLRLPFSMDFNIVFISGIELNVLFVSETLIRRELDEGLTHNSLQYDIYNLFTVTLMPFCTEKKNIVIVGKLLWNKTQIDLFVNHSYACLHKKFGFDENSINCENWS